MTIKLINPTLTHLQKVPSIHGQELKGWYDIQRQIFQKMDNSQMELDINRAIHKPIFLQKSAEKNIFLNNLPVLFGILHNRFSVSQLIQPLTVLTMDNEQLDMGVIFFETVELISRQKKLLNVKQLSKQIAPLLTKEQWQSILGHTKLTQNKFYPLIGISSATAHSYKEESDGRE